MFKDKNDPLLNVAKEAIQKGDDYRKAVSEVNEHFGVYSRRALPLTKKAEYDVALKKVLGGEKLTLSEDTLEEARKITKNVVGAFLKREKFKDKNSSTDGDSLHLHGNKIAWHSPDGSIKGTLAGWPTHTTRERLHHLSVEANGVDYSHEKHAIYQKNNKQYHGKTEIGHDDVFDIKSAPKKSIDETEQLEERVLANKNDDYSPSYEKSNQKNARAKRISNKLKDKKQLDEASKAKLQNYVQKAIEQQQLAASKRTGKMDDNETLIRKRGRGINNAKDKLEGPRGPNRSYQTAPDGKMKPTKVFAKEEECEGHEDEKEDKALIKKIVKKEALKESIPKDADASEYIHDFVHSKDKRFDGDSKKERIKRALGAYYSKKVNESKEQLNELSKKVLGSYIKKASKDIGTKTKKIAALDDQGKYDSGTKEHFKKSNRLRGISNAVNKLVKEDVSVENIKEEIANSLYKKYEAINEDAKQAWVDALNEEEFNILYEFYNSNVKFRQVSSNPIRTIVGTIPTTAGLAKAAFNRKPEINPAAAEAGAEKGMEHIRNMAQDSPTSVYTKTPALKSQMDIERPEPMRNVNPVSVMRPDPKITGSRAPGAATLMQSINDVRGNLPTNNNVTASDKNVNIGDGKDEYGNIIPASKIADAIKSAATNNTQANAEKIGATLAASAKPDEKIVPSHVAAATSSTNDSETQPVAQTQAAATETRNFREPMVPKRSWGFGDQGSGSQTAGAITNRALGAVNEEENKELRGPLDAWLKKYSR